MSADNWGECPRCKASRDKDLEEQRIKVESAYGKVSPTEYQKLLKAYEKRVKLEEENTNLREDYHIGIYNGEFSASYLGSCSVCDFEFKFDFATSDINK